jgi:DNA-binding transcriptional regulator YiaG
MASMTAASLHVALAKHRERAPYGRLPQDLRRQAESYAQERVRTGAATATIASELGVSETTVRAWARGRARAAPAAQRASGVSAPVAMVPLMVRPGPETGAGARLEISFPDGTKVQVAGMAGRDLVEALTALRGAR